MILFCWGKKAFKQYHVKPKPFKQRTMVCCLIQYEDGIFFNTIRFSDSSFLRVNCTLICGVGWPWTAGKSPLLLTPSASVGWGRELEGKSEKLFGLRWMQFNKWKGAGGNKWCKCHPSLPADGCPTSPQATAALGKKPLCFIAKCDSLWCGVSSGSFQVSPPGCVPSQPLALPTAGGKVTITGWVRFRGTTGGHLIQAPCSSRFPRPPYWELWPDNVSPEKEALQPLRAIHSST